MNAITSFRGDYDFLSNFYLCPIEAGDLTYRCAEALFQAAKSRDKRDWWAMHFLDGGNSKRAGREVTLRSDWDEYRTEAMLHTVYMKFEQNANLRAKLIATGQQRLEEGNTWGDTFWGTVDGIGENWLGKILMMVRTELQPKDNS